MIYVKPQSPIRKGDTGIYPLTTYDQIIMKDGNRFDGELVDLSNYYTKDELKAALLDLIYPVGSIYISLNSTNPSTIFGGKWEQIQGRFLLGVSSSHPVNQTGGEESHTLTQNEIPKYTIPKANLSGNIHGGDSSLFTWNATTDGIISSSKPNRTYTVQRINNNTSNFVGEITVNASHSHSSGGGGQAHNNMPPYIAVYIWKRTA